jgi:FkbM family methyltransferase
MGYSQNDEERVILEYFGDYVGTFIDIGCNDCETFSNTRALAQRGWKGIFVDPIPEAIKRCKKLYEGYKGFYFYELAITDHNGKKVIDASGSLCSPADNGLVSTFHAHEKARFDKSVSYTPLEVNTKRWKTFLNMKRITEFDFVSIDVEGDELVILPEMDLSKTRMICLEWNSKPELKDAYEKYLDGFKLIYTSGENLIYAR